ncbi:ATP-binding cassette domain-containing protein [Serratia liquefaciens]|uniref:ATP-binding cassette domain-containing protein n=1 Tax=Serratia liquefaciens TaxID=614 RepID=UPI00035853BF|nr:ATP-binding cassette domain-containing protein [Serratia liquefaciens]AGQ31130.1 ABC transporter [Serratia liquefaciens ATCC 27592]CAI0813748.1 Putative multidrug export ATP-binding/permease protein SAV1866 [Serratia liquefaciens]CAI2070379.1 Putative multidrug export ATP-binding/permease protein SAV1866 [Serratia liquefaciens]CAI2438960.1 Putative multidrug export ATP-binding/permease protein SAV1866 [Serratia liquefaciens]HBL6729135.1 ATP-binding cassette domain-containing protein [Serrat
MNKFLFIIRYFKGTSNLSAKGNFFVIITISLLSTVLISVQPVIMAKLISGIESESVDFKFIIYALALSYIVVMSLRKLASALNFILITSLRSNLVISMTNDYFKSLFYNADAIKIHENTGDITQRLNQAIDELTVLLRNISHNFIPPLLQLVLSVAFIVISGDYIVAMLFTLYFLLYFIIKGVFNPKIVGLYNDFYNTSVKKYSLITDSVKNMGAAKVCNSYDYLFGRYEALLHKIETKHEKLLKADMHFLLVESACNIIFFGLSFLYSLYQVMSGNISIGHFVMISSYILLLSSPLESMGSMYTALQKSTVSLYGFISAMPMIVARQVDSEQIKPVDSMTMRDLSFSYQGEGGAIIKDLNLEIDKGHFITLTGRSGSGKSTVAKLLAGELKPEQGEILINNMNINELSSVQRAELVFHVSQNDYIFMDTLRFNLKIACPEATDEQLAVALRLSRLDDLVNDGNADLLDMRIGDNGVTLSGGQRQRLSLARLFLRTPSIIILDEVTSALDVINERGIMHNIKICFPNALILNISHRSSTFDFSDEILVMDSGRIVASGDFVTLKNNNAYIQSILRQEALKQAS